MAIKHEVSLTFRSTGTVVDVFDRYDVKCSMLEPGCPWTFSLWRHGRVQAAGAVSPERRRSAWDALKREAKNGERVVFAIDGAVQLVGVIETRKVHHTREGAVLVISGRDLSGLALDGDASPNVQLRDAPLDDVLGALFQTVGVPVSFADDADAHREAQTRARPGHRAPPRRRHRHRVDLAHPKPGERVWQVMESVLRPLALMAWVAPTSDASLAVIVGRPDYDQAPTFRLVAEEYGGVIPTVGNVLEADYTVNTRDVPTDVHVMARSARGDKQPSRIAQYHTNAAMYDRPEVSRHLPPLVRYLPASNARTPDAADAEAWRVIADAMVHFRQYACTVQGHGQNVGSAWEDVRLYAVNTVAHVRDEFAGVSEPMLIHGLEFHGSRGEGQTTRLELHPLGAIDLDARAAAATAATEGA